jgi:predicted peptidase
MADVACGGSRPTGPDGAAFPQRAGIYQRTLPPRNLRYTVAIPNGFKSDQAASLILALHFGGQVTPFYGGLFLDGLVGPALQELEAIMVAPDAMAGTWSSPEGETNVLEVLNAVQSNYKIDPRRTLVTGYSMGGAGTWYLAARNQKRFAAALPMAGRPPAEAMNAAWEIPIYAIHSRQDEVVPFGPTETAINQLRAKGASVELAAVDGITHFETVRFVGPLRAAVPWIRGVWR